MRPSAATGRTGSKPTATAADKHSTTRSTAHGHTAHLFAFYIHASDRLRAQRDKNFCVPLAIAAVTGKDIDAVNADLIAQGNRKRGHGTFNWLQAAERNGANLRRVDDKLVRAQVKTGNAARDKLSDGRAYVLWYRGHVGAMVRGAWHDWNTNRRRIHAIYEVLPFPAACGQPTQTTAQSTQLTGASEMNALHYYSSKSKAIRAACGKSALGPKAVEGTHFRLVAHDHLKGQYAYVAIEQPAAPAVKPARKASAPRKPKAEKAELLPRVVQHGVVRPRRATTSAGRIWAILDQLTDNGKALQPDTLERAKVQCSMLELNPANVVIEFYAWRKFNGYRGRLETDE